MRHKFILLISAMLIALTCSAQIIDLSPNRPDEIPKEQWRQLPRDIRKDVKQDFKQERKNLPDADNAIIIPPGESVSVPYTPAVARALKTEANWGRSFMGMPNVSDKFVKRISGSKFAIIGLADTGKPDHDALNEFLWMDFAKSYTGEPILDGHNHATHIAGSIYGQVGNQVFGVLAEAAKAGKVRLVPYKVCSNAGRCPNNAIAQSIRDFTDATAEYRKTGHLAIMNMSLGSNAESSIIKEAIAYATDRGVIIVAAAGNRGSTPISYPGRDKNTIASGAIDKNGNRASFSQYGENLMFTGPGVLIPSTCKGNSLCIMSGTSMGTPHTLAGITAAALLYPDLSPAELIDYVAVQAEDLGDAGWDKYNGYGYVLIEKLLNNPPNGDTPDDPRDNPDDPGEDEPEREQRSMTFTFQGEFPMYYTQVNTADEHVDKGVLLSTDDSKQLANNWKMLTVTELVVEVKTKKSAAATRALLLSNTTGYFRNRGVGLRAPADHYDALVWSLYFYDMMLTRAENPQEITVIAARAQNANGDPVSVIEHYGQTKKWPRSENKQEAAAKKKRWVIDGVWLIPNMVGGNGLPEYRFGDWAVYSVEVRSNNFPTRQEMTEASPIPGAKLERIIQITAPQQTTRQTGFHE